MADEASARAFAESIAIEDEPDLSGLDEMQIGQVHCWHTPEGWAFQAVRKPGLTPEYREQFDQFARMRAYMLALNEDPEHVDGWYKRESDDGFQITCRIVDLR